MATHNDALKIGIRIPRTQANQLEEMAEVHGLTTATVARILINKALAAGITV